MTAVWGRTRTVASTPHTTSASCRAPSSTTRNCVPGMPPRLAAASGMNALAHCLEALWSRREPDHDRARSRRRSHARRAGFHGSSTNPDDVDAHGNNLIGACLAGVAMAQAGIGIHHRTAHVLGGGWKTAACRDPCRVAAAVHGNGLAACAGSDARCDAHARRDDPPAHSSRCCSGSNSCRRCPSWECPRTGSTRRRVGSGKRRTTIRSSPTRRPCVRCWTTRTSGRRP